MALFPTPLSAPALASRRLPLAGEDETYAKSRRALLAEEIDLRRRMARVAEIRRALPSGPLLPDYRFRNAAGDMVGLADLFGERDTLMLYVCDFGSLGPAPLCYHFLAAVQANADALRTRAEFSVLSLAPAMDVDRFAELHHWQPLRPHQIAAPEFAGDMHLLDPTGHCIGTLLVCRKSEDGIRLFWKSEFTDHMSDAGESQRDVFELASIWSLLDVTPKGRSANTAPERDFNRMPWDQAGTPDVASGRWPRPVYGIA